MPLSVFSKPWLEYTFLIIGTLISSEAGNPRGLGQGVVNLVLLQMWLNLLCVPLLCMEVLLTVMPMEEFPGQLCVYFELMMALTAVNRHMGSVIVAVGRYGTISCLSCQSILLSLSTFRLAQAKN